MKRSAALAAGLVLPMLPAAAAAASPAAGAAPFVTAGSRADAPTGFVQMCARDAVLCRAGLPDTAVATTAITPSCAIAADTIDRPFAWSRAMSVGLWRDDIDRVACTAGASPSPIVMATAAAVPVVGLPLPSITAAGTAAIDPRAVRRGRDRRDISAETLSAGDDAQLIKIINRRVNRQVIATPDIASRGVEEEWTRPGLAGRPAGDCEDYAIEKRMRLVEAGFAPNRLFFAVVYRPNFGLHTVLVARLSSGDVVLDSARANIVPWRKSRYVWLRVQSPVDPLVWTTVAA